MNNKKEHIEWWKKEVAYQIYPKSFYDSNNDGIGDLNGITEKLDYLSDLGITLIWICPIFKSPMDDNGYDISDYYDIAPEFGTLKDLDNLIKEAKKRNIKIILDLVINHTSDEHEWFQEALKNPESKYRDYYIFKRGKNGLPPTNWRSHFGGSVWEKIEGERDKDGNEMYYLHLFTKKQPDLNWENPEVRKELYKMVNYWLEKGIAGFRIDAINSIKKDQRYLDLPVDGVDGLGFNIKYTLNQTGIEEFLEELSNETFKKYNCVTVAETPDLEYDRYEKFIGENGFFSMIFDFNYADLDMEEGTYFRRRNFTVKELKEKIFQSQKIIQKYGWGAPFLENHDQPRSIDKYFGENAGELTAKLLGSLFFFLKGTPFIYQGQELGISNFERKSVEEFDDIASKDQYYRAIKEGYSPEEALYHVNRRSRDNSRTPFHWNANENGGFSEIPVKTWIKMNDSYKNINVAAQIKNKSSVLSYYKKMIRLRQNSKYSNCLIFGEFIPVSIENDEVIAYLRTDNEHKIICVNNFSNKKKDIKFSVNFKIKEILLTNIENPEVKENGIILNPFQTILAVTE